MKQNKLNRFVWASLSVAMLFLSTNMQAQRRGGGGGYHPAPAYHFGGGVHVNGGYYAPRASYRYIRPGFGATHYIYHPRYSFIGFGGVNYGYYNGLFYQRYGFGLHLVFPPFGIRVGVLPIGYYPFYFGANPYYYYGGVFYSPYSDGGYQVVAPPLGSLVPELPAGATVQVINGQEFYQYYGTFYQKQVNDNGEVWYKVVGRNGKLETGQPQYDQQYQPSQPSQPAAVQPPVAPVPGDLLSKLPDGCKAVTVNGEQYFEAPDGTYYQEVIGEDNKVMYQLVDKATMQTQPSPVAPGN